MTVQELIDALTTLRDALGVGPSAPVILEGYDDQDEFLQADILSVATEHRCEDDDEPQGVYLTFDESDPNPAGQAPGAAQPKGGE